MRENNYFIKSLKKLEERLINDIAHEKDELNLELLKNELESVQRLLKKRSF